MRRSLLALLLAGCGASPAPAPATPHVGLVDLAWLTNGPWQSEPDENACLSVETWQRTDDTHLTGHVIQVCAADDSVAQVTEEIVLEERPAGIFYVASPVGQERTEFQLTDGDATHFVVENPSHDFPTRIAYRLVDETHAEAIVSGGDRSFTVRMTRAAADPDPE